MESGRLTGTAGSIRARFNLRVQGTPYLDRVIRNAQQSRSSPTSQTARARADRSDCFRRVRRCVGARDTGLETQGADLQDHSIRSEEHTSELQSLMRISYAVFCLKKKKTKH